MAGFLFPVNNACMQFATMEFSKLAHEKKHWEWKVKFYKRI